MKRIAVLSCVLVLFLFMDTAVAQREVTGTAAMSQGHGGKLLVVILTGSEDPYKVEWGLRLALNAYTHPYGEKLLDDVKVLLFSRGVTIVNPRMPFYKDFQERLLALKRAGVEVAGCISGLQEMGLEKEAEEQGIKLVHASVYTSIRVGEGYAIMTF